MIDKLLSYTKQHTTTAFTITDNCIFIDKRQHLTAEGMLENIAQTCAARIGYENYIAGDTVKLGFIGAVKSFYVSDKPSIGDTIITMITVKEQIFGITLVDASIKLNDNEIASTTMKIALSNIEASI